MKVNNKQNILENSNCIASNAILETIWAIGVNVLAGALST
jgi:hypothetical protein